MDYITVMWTYSILRLEETLKQVITLLMADKNTMKYRRTVYCYTDCILHTLKNSHKIQNLTEFPVYKYTNICKI
jgi:hypothetical protein